MSGLILLIVAYVVMLYTWSGSENLFLDIVDLVLFVLALGTVGFVIYNAALGNW